MACHCQLNDCMLWLMSPVIPEVRTQFLTELMGDEVIVALDQLLMDFRMLGELKLDCRM